MKGELLFFLYTDITDEAGESDGFNPSEGDPSCSRAGPLQEMTSELMNVQGSKCWESREVSSLTMRSRQPSAASRRSWLEWSGSTQGHQIRRSLRNDLTFFLRTDEGTRRRSPTTGFPANQSPRSGEEKTQDHLVVLREPSALKRRPPFHWPAASPTAKVSNMDEI